LPENGSGTPDIDCGVALRPLNRYLSESGDSARIYQTVDGCTLILLDVLGHGANARVVAERAERYLDAHSGDGLTELLLGLHTHLLGSRGAVAACCRFDRQTQTLACAGIGNISVKVIRARQESLISRDGVIGYHTIRPHITQTAFKPGDILLMHTDGIKSTVNYALQTALLQKGAGEIADAVLKEYATKTDDACCIVMKYLP